MIVSALLGLLYVVFDILTSVISIPGMPDSVKEILAITLDYMTSGICIVTQFLDLNYLFMLFSLVVIISGGIRIKKFVMWVVRKIPHLSIR